MRDQGANSSCSKHGSLFLEQRRKKTRTCKKAWRDLFAAWKNPKQKGLLQCGTCMRLETELGFESPPLTTKSQWGGWCRG